ncbi:MAG TPA: alanyl-tRNA editing protein, partial [Candidatus Krumholzibacteria bacterium]|nr:alanyl-tRNA editing protein [Candidatus Krumholzibacteria bacterium]
QKLYLDRSYDTAFEAEVISARTREDGTVAVVLDRTLFYPESGGQLPDGGVLGGFTVSDVQEGESESVVHAVHGPIEPGARVSGAVDWSRRFDHMQQHTGQHVLSRAFIATGGLHTVSFHMGMETCTIDLDGSGFDAAAVRRAEDLANGVIAENRPIDITTVPVEELDQIELRRKVPEGVRAARIVSVRDFDVIPCCGTHVRSTGELGTIKVLKSERVRQTQRVHFKVGRRAFDDYRDKHDIVAALANQLTTAPPDLTAKVGRLAADAQTAARRAKTLIERLAAAEGPRLAAAAARAGDIRLLVHRDPDPAYVRALASEVQGGAKTVAILGADDGTVVCVASRDVELDLATGAPELARELGGSGGGRGGFVQLKLADGTHVEELMTRMDAHVRSRLA